VVYYDPKEQDNGLIYLKILPAYKLSSSNYLFNIFRSVPKG